MSTTSTTDYVVAFTPNRVWAGPLNGTRTQVGSDGLQGPDIESFAQIDPSDGIPKVWALDGTSEIAVDVAGNTVKPWRQLVRDSNRGVLPTGCALCCRAFGSAVLARPRDNSSMWFMSRKFNPVDWNYGAAPRATTALNGADPRLGIPGDAITALIPAGEDYLLFGCRESIYYLVGDPRSGGGVCNVLTRKTSVAGPRAWCFDERGRLWFVGNNGLNVLASIPGQPVNVSGDRLRGILNKLDIEAVRIEMVYDSAERTVHLFITPLDLSAGTHICIQLYPNGELRFIGLDAYPASFGPLSAAAINADTYRNRRFIIGGTDGYTRQPDHAVYGDDGSAIAAYFDCPPIEAPAGMQTLTTKELQVFAGPGSEGVTYEWFTAPSPDEVRPLTGSPTATGALFTDAGLQTPIRMRHRAGAHKLRIRQTSATDGFSFGRAILRAEPGARRRQA